MKIIVASDYDKKSNYMGVSWAKAAQTVADCNNTLFEEIQRLMHESDKIELSVCGDYCGEEVINLKYDGGMVEYKIMDENL